MRILHTLENFKRNGGVGTYLAGVIAAQAKAGMDVRVLSATTDSTTHLWDAAEGFVPDVVHAHDYWVPEPRVPAPVVQSLHNYDFSCSSNTRYLGQGQSCERPHGVGCVAQWPRCLHSPRVPRFVRNFASTSVRLQQVKEAREVVAYSNFTARVAVQNGIHADRVHTIWCPAPSFASDVDIDYSRAVPGLVTYVGRLSKAKGVDVAIEAVARVPAATLKIVGDGYARDDLETLARRVAPGRVQFTGWADGTDLAERYAEASAVVMPGRWPEPFGLVGLEAAWAGRPVIASFSGGVEEWLRHEQTGLGVIPGDVQNLSEAIQRLIGAPDEAADLGRAGRRLAEDWPTNIQHAEQLNDVYSKALIDR